MKKSNFFSILLRVFVIVLLLSLFLVPPVFAQTGEPPTPPAPVNVNEFLQWLIGGGGSILAVSWILERLKWFQGLPPDIKDYTIFGAAVVVGCGALAVVMYVPPAVLEAIAPFFLIVASTFVTVFIAKVFHQADKTG